jgi:hypothetical protein
MLSLVHKPSPPRVCRPCALQHAKHVRHGPSWHRAAVPAGGRSTSWVGGATPHLSPCCNDKHRRRGENSNGLPLPLLSCGVLLCGVAEVWRLTP